jgi:hypothetical protein
MSYRPNREPLPATLLFLLEVTVDVTCSSVKCAKCASIVTLISCLLCRNLVTALYMLHYVAKKKMSKHLNALILFLCVDGDSIWSASLLTFRRTRLFAASEP